MNVNLCDRQETCEQDLIVAQSSQETTKKKYEETLPNVVMPKCEIVNRNDEKVRICDMWKMKNELKK